MTDLDLPQALTEEIQAEAKAAEEPVETLLRKALQHYRLEVQKRKIDAEASWWNSLPADVRQKYAGEYVAVHGEQVVDHDVDRAALYDRIRQRYGNVGVLITPGKGTPSLHILSPRLERL